MAMTAAVHSASMNPLVCIIDTDRAVRESLSLYLGASNMAVRAFKDGESFLEFIDSKRLSQLPGCLVLELNLPSMSGIELMHRLDERGIRIPCILLSSTSDVPTAVHGIRAGAFDFIEKPFVDAVLLARINEALADSSQREE